jgi:hypothetical protein
MNKSFNERRKHVRIYRNFIMTYHEKGKSSAKHKVSQVKNVSKGGMSFTSTHPLDQGTVVLIDLKVPFVAHPIHLEGIVLECQEKISEMIYHVRLQFHEISAHVLTVLEKIESYAGGKEG